MRPFTVRLAALTGAAVLLAGAAAAQPPAPAAPGRTQFVYLYQRPAGLLSTPPARLALARPAQAAAAAEAAKAKVERLARALGVPLRDVQQKDDRHGETLRLASGRHAFKAYPPSGMIKYRNQDLYNQDLAEERAASPISRERALALARELAGKLAAARLVEPRELLYPAARFASRMENEGQGAPQGAPGRRAPLAKARAADLRVFLPRALDGVPVAGQGLRLTFTPGGQLAGLDLLVRDVALESGRALPVVASGQQARAAFERTVKVPAGSRVEVLAYELVYVEPGLRHPVAFLEPAYQFVYRVKTPIPGQRELTVSKVLHWELPAIRHGERQAPSPRVARLREIDRRLPGKRPATPPQIRKPAPGQEERDEGRP